MSGSLVQLLLRARHCIHGASSGTKLTGRACWRRNVAWYVEAACGYVPGDCVVEVRFVVVVIRARHIVVRHRAYGLAPAKNLLGRRRRRLLATGVKRVGGIVVRHLGYSLAPSKFLLGRRRRADRDCCGLRSSRGFLGGLGLGLEELEGHSGSTLGNLRA